MIGEGYTEEEQLMLRKRMNDLHASGGGSEGMSVPYLDGEIGEVVFRIIDKDGNPKARKA
jgi:hypothetical protein